MISFDTTCAALVCLAKLALPPACVHALYAPPAAPDHAGAFLSHGRGPAGDFLPDAEQSFVMGAAAEVAMKAPGSG